MSATRILSVGSALPAAAVSNEQLVAELAARGVETSDEWIVSRTGIRQRHLARAGETTAGLAEQAARAALGAAGVEASAVDLIIVATSSPEAVFPSTACQVQARIGARGAAFDLQAACSGFVYGIAVADALLRTGAHARALVIGAEIFSRLLDWNDRSTCVLFGDGAGAVLLERGEGEGILSCHLGADGARGGILSVASCLRGGQATGDPFLRMDGQAVFRLAVEVLEDSARAALADAGMQMGDLDWFIAHQANVRILHACAKRMGIDAARVVVTVDRHGNTSAASVPLAMDIAWRDGRLHPGQLLLLQGVGGGFTWGSVVLRWSAGKPR